MKTRKKRFFVSQSLQTSLSDTVNVVKNNAGSVRFEVIPLTWIETDPANPRELKLTVHDIQNGIEKSDSHFNEKTLELGTIQSLSETIRSKGLINPVVVYKFGDKYRLVAGERRFLASLLAKKEDIQARILNERPKTLELRLLQWIENTEREDLSLKDRIENVKLIVNEYIKEHSDVEVTASLIKELIHISLPQATCYVSLLNMTEDLQEQISSSKITNLDKAALIAKIQNEKLRKQAIQNCVSGDSIKQLRALIEQTGATNLKNTAKTNNRKRGRAFTQIHLGTTKKPEVVKKIVTLILKHPEYNHFNKDFAATDWKEYEHATSAFKKLLAILENEGTK